LLPPPPLPAAYRLRVAASPLLASPFLTHAALSPCASQVESGVYSARVNFGLLRLYQLYPGAARGSLDMLLLLLAKALTALPEPDFLQAVFLASPRHMADARARGLVELDALLQRADFAGFWARTAAPELRAVLDRVPGFDETLRSFVVLALSRTYQTIELAELEAALGLARGEAQAYAAQRGWPAAEGSRVRLPPTPETTPRPARAAVEELGLRPHDVLSLLTTLQRDLTL
jgi:hypothetical protein